MRYAFFLFLCVTSACAVNPNLGDGDLECGAGGLCPAGLMCDEAQNRCVSVFETGTRALGEVCESGSQCQSGICADGVCCNALCSGQCEFCNEAGAEGTCLAVEGDPRGERRDPCAGDGTVCGGTCDGENRTACAYPEDECEPGACADGVFTEPSTCSAGACVAGGEITCGETTETSDAKYCVEPSGCVGVTQLTAGYDFTCALMSDFTVMCWGANYVGQLGQGEDEDGEPDIEARYEPVRVKGLADVTKVSAGAASGGHVCALLADKTVACWGGNNYGQLGRGHANLGGDPTPAPMMLNSTDLLEDINDISTGQVFSCALNSSGTVRCVGGNYSGQLGDGSIVNERLFPVRTGTAGEYGHIWSGYNHSCGAMGTESPTTVKCWGSNAGGACGIDTPPAQVTTPALAAGFDILNATLAQPIGTGGSTGLSCGIGNNSVLQCWGWNFYRQLGRVTDENSDPDAAPVSCSSCNADVLNQTTSFGISEQAACAVRSGSVYCWGQNSNGQFGDGSPAHTTGQPNQRTNAQPVAFSGGTPSAIQVAAGGFHMCSLHTDGTVRCWGWNGDGQLGTGEAGANALVPEEVAF